MNLFCGCLLCCYIFRLFRFSPICSHMSTLCHFNSGEVYSWSWIGVPPGVCVLICQFYLPLIKYHQSFSLRLLKREDSSLLHCVIRFRLENNVSLWLLSTNLLLDDHYRFVGPCHLQFIRCECVFCNLIDAFWRGLDGGYTCLCVCIMLSGLRGGRWV